MTAMQLRGSNDIKPHSINAKHDLCSPKDNIDNLIKLVPKRVSAEQIIRSLLGDQNRLVKIGMNRKI